MTSWISLTTSLNIGEKVQGLLPDLHHNWQPLLQTLSIFTHLLFTHHTSNIFYIIYLCPELILGWKPSIRHYKDIIIVGNYYHVFKVKYKEGPLKSSTLTCAWWQTEFHADGYDGFLSDSRENYKTESAFVRIMNDSLLLSDCGHDTYDTTHDWALSGRLSQTHGLWRYAVTGCGSVSFLSVCEWSRVLSPGIFLVNTFWHEDTRCLFPSPRQWHCTLWIYQAQN